MVWQSWTGWLRPRSLPAAPLTSGLCFLSTQPVHPLVQQAMEDMVGGLLSSSGIEGTGRASDREQHTGLCSQGSRAGRGHHRAHCLWGGTGAEKIIRKAGSTTEVQPRRGHAAGARSAWNVEQPSVRTQATGSLVQNAHCTPREAGAGCGEVTRQRRTRSALAATLADPAPLPVTPDVLYPLARSHPQSCL